MWQYRELIKNLTIAEFKNRYQNTTLGFFWSLLSPLLLSLVLWFVFRHLFQQEENFAVNLLVGIMAWRFFAIGTSSALQSVVSRPSLVTKVYIPRQILVLSTVLANVFSSFLEFLVLLPILFVLLGHLPFTVPLFILVHIVYAFLIYGVGLFLAALFVYFRDLNQIWEVLTNILFFCSPIIYPLSLVPPQLLAYYILNPVTQFILVYRNLMVAGTLPSVDATVGIIGIGVVAWLVGTFAFSRLQRRFAEEV